MPSSQPPYRAVYAYPWDVAQAEALKFAEIVSAQGISDITLALSYHAGKFLSPRRKTGRVYFPEDGAVYFQPTLSSYGRIKPYPHPDEDLRNVATRLIEASGLAVNAWVVLFHNTRLGTTYPDATARNAWRDRYIYSLCPVNPQVAEFGTALLRDIAATLSLKSIVVETPGFLPYPHGYHHEFAQVPSQRWLETLLALCFCDHCLNESRRETGIDSQALQSRIANLADAYLASSCDVPSDMASGWITADLLADVELAGFLRWRSRHLSGLVKQFRATLPDHIPLAVIPTVQRPTATSWIEGSDLGELAKAADYLEVPFYEPTAARAIADAWDTLRRSGGHSAKIRAILRPGPPDLDGGHQTAEAVIGIAELGIRDFAFYNWGLLRKQDFARIGPALKNLDCSQISKDL
jgi:hypothetical protein